MASVAMVAKTQVNWGMFLLATKVALSRSVLSGVDAVGMQSNNLASFVAALGELETPGVGSRDVLAEPGHLLKCAHFTFLVASERGVYLDVLRRSQLCVVGIDERCYTISGDLTEWQRAVIDACSATAPEELRDVFNQCMVALEAEGFFQLWSNYAKRQSADRRTFLLEDRR